MDTLPAAKPVVEEEVWTTMDGRKIPIGEMEVDHLRNAMRTLMRKKRMVQASRAYSQDLEAQRRKWQDDYWREVFDISDHSGHPEGK